ncbi:MAG: DNA recombination protein RmuC, partial [Idiomarina sp.]|nr:DNA recombination protein RmuC [Idiomarina sp.]
GDTKQQGNWGEVVLERILEQSGLREGHEYQTQAHHRDEDGKSFKPDVIVHLPNKKDVVIDSKVSLSAYERYFNSDDDADRERALNEHVQSLKQHIKQLGKKSYHQLEGLRTLDYVLMFIPIEPAFLLAVDRDPELIRLALDNQIMLVSPTNLLVALRTVHNIWQYEYQNQNAEKIATDAARLYDKFVGFVEDLEKIGNGLQTLDNRYQEAMKKLSTGRGNLIGRVDKFRQMGVQTNKRLNPDYLDSEETSPEGIESDGADKKND